MIINDKNIDWRGEWILRSEARDTPDDSATWDARAPKYSDHSGLSEYADEFIHKLNPEPEAAIFDMGCGNGALAVPLAQMGHRVIGADFSPGMRAALAKQATEDGVSEKIEIRSLSWEDDWQAAGIAAKSVDIAIASRCLMVHDLASAFEKLEYVARHRVAVTISTRFGPREQYEVGDDYFGTPFLPDHIYALNILFDMGRDPSISYISSQKPDGEGGSRLIRWAFISWDVSP
jgi:SAM-dependent methyltransferase